MSRTFAARLNLRSLASLIALAGAVAGCVVPVGVTYPADREPVTAWPGAATCPVPSRSASDAAAIVTLVNAARAEAGLGPVSLSAPLSGTAHRHACDNAARQSISHDGSDGSTLAMRLHRDGVKVFYAAENTGLGFDTPQIAMAWWMGSPGHRANILAPEITQIGVGQADGVPRPTWVLDFIAPR